MQVSYQNQLLIVSNLQNQNVTDKMTTITLSRMQEEG